MGCAVRFMLQLLSLPGMSPLYPLNRKLYGLQSWSEYFGEAITLDPTWNLTFLGCIALSLVSMLTAIVAAWIRRINNRKRLIHCHCITNYVMYSCFEF
jgi:hypothetical protein